MHHMETNMRHISEVEARAAEERHIYHHGVCTVIPIYTITYCDADSTLTRTKYWRLQFALGSTITIWI